MSQSPLWLRIMRWRSDRGSPAPSILADRAPVALGEEGGRGLTATHVDADERRSLQAHDAPVPDEPVPADAPRNDQAREDTPVPTDAPHHDQAKEQLEAQEAALVPAVSSSELANDQAVEEAPVPTDSSSSSVKANDQAVEQAPVPTDSSSSSQQANDQAVEEVLVPAISSSSSDQANGQAVEEAPVPAISSSSSEQANDHAVEEAPVPAVSSSSSDQANVQAVEQAPAPTDSSSSSDQANDKAVEQAPVPTDSSSSSEQANVQAVEEAPVPTDSSSSSDQANDQAVEEAPVPAISSSSSDQANEQAVEEPVPADESRDQANERAVPADEQRDRAAAEAPVLAVELEDHTHAPAKRIALFVGGVLRKYDGANLKAFTEHLPVQDTDLFASLNAASASDLAHYSELYGPVKVEVREFQFDPSQFPFVQQNKRWGQVNTLSMFHHNSRAMDMVMEHAHQRGCGYDVVIKYRSDIVARTPLVIPPVLEPDTVYVPHGEDWGGLNDQVAFGDAASMVKYCSLFQCVKGYCEGPTRVTFHAETLLAHHVRAVGLAVQRISFSYGLDPLRHTPHGV